MAARRVVAVSSEIRPVTCPTGPNTPIENKAKKPALSNAEKSSSLGRFMKPEHKRMSRMLGYCLTLGTADSWSGFSFVAASRLSDTERAALAFSALNSLELDHAETTAAASIGSAGAPLPPFLGGMDEARFWASCASRSERKAYALASFEAMSAKDQAAFFRHISKMEVAA